MACQPTAGLTFPCTQKTSLRVTCGNYVESPVVFVFLQRNCHCNSVVSQISEDARLAPILYTGLKFLSHRGSNQYRILSVSSKQYTLRLGIGSNKYKPTSGALPRHQPHYCKLVLTTVRASNKKLSEQIERHSSVLGFSIRIELASFHGPAIPRFPIQ